MAGSKVDMRVFERAIANALDDVESTAIMQQAGQFAADRIVKRTRLGKGVESRGGDPQSLKPLSASYKEQRKGKLAFFTTASGVKVPFKPDRTERLDGTTSAGKSNLTRTGQLLRSIKVIAVKAGSVVIGPTGGRVGSFLNNKDVARYVQEERPFLNLSKPEVNALAKFFREKLSEALKKALT